MTQFHSPNPPDFNPLRDFLRDNAPQPPTPNPELEAQLMEAIESLPQESAAQGEAVLIPRGISKRWWILATAIVTRAGLMWGGRSGCHNDRSRWWHLD